MSASLATIESLPVSSASRFDLSDGEIRSRTSELLSHLEPTDGRYLGTVVAPDSPMFDAVCSLEREVFEQAFEGNDTAYMEHKYGPLTDSSRFLVVIEKEGAQEYQGRPIAFMRIVTPAHDADSTLSLDDAAENIHKTPKEIRQIHNIGDLSESWDVATMGVLQEYHNTLASIDARAILNRIFMRLAAAERVEHMIAIIDQKALDGLLLVGTPLVPMGDPEGKFDEEHAFTFDSSEKSYAVYGHVPSFLASVRERYDELADGAKTNAGVAFLRQVVGSILVADQVDKRISLPPNADV